MVMVSDIYRVPANVDPSTGDIEYNGTVEVAGNVATGFKVKAEGDIIVMVWWKAVRWSPEETLC